MTRFKIDALALVSYLPDFQRYIDTLRQQRDSDDSTLSPAEEMMKDPRRTASIIEHVDFLLRFLNEEFKDHIRTLRSLLQHGEISLTLLHHILHPGNLVLTVCPITRELRVVRLLKLEWNIKGFWQLHTSYVAEDVDDQDAHSPKKYGLSHLLLVIQSFNGATKINTLSSYPLKWHPQPDILKEQLVRRGYKWRSLIGVHHMHYDGMMFIIPPHNFRGVTPETLNERRKIYVSDSQLSSRSDFAALCAELNFYSFLIVCRQNYGRQE